MHTITYYFKINRLTYSYDTFTCNIIYIFLNVFSYEQFYNILFLQIE